MLSCRIIVKLCVVLVFTAVCVSKVPAQETRKPLPPVERITISPIMVDGKFLSGWEEFDTSSIIWATKILRHSLPVVPIGFGSSYIEIGNLELHGIAGQSIPGGMVGQLFAGRPIPAGMGTFCPLPGTYTAHAVRENTGTDVGQVTVIVAAENDQPCTLTSATITKDGNVNVDYSISPAWAGQAVSFTAFLSATPDGNPYDSTAFVIWWQRIGDLDYKLNIDSDPRLSSGEHKNITLFNTTSLDPVTPLIPDKEHPYIIIESNYDAFVIGSNIDRNVIPMLAALGHASKISLPGIPFSKVLTDNFKADLGNTR